VIPIRDSDDARPCAGTSAGAWSCRCQLPDDEVIEVAA
jgi:hypothetical protein